MSDAAAFDRLYAASADPWGFASSRYELDRYEAILRTVGNGPFRHGFEPGCSIGVLTARLAARCERLSAIDLAPRAVALARQRCAGLPNVELSVGSVAGPLPDGPWDLVVLAELGYYFSADHLDALLGRVLDRMRAGAILVASHWRGVSDSHELHGDDVHRVMRNRPQLRLDLAEPHRGFLLDRYRRC